MSYQDYICTICKTEFAIADSLASMTDKLLCKKCGGELKKSE